MISLRKCLDATAMQLIDNPFLETKNASSFVRYKNATLEGLNISVIQLIDKDPKLDVPALTRIYPDGYTERECLAQCAIDDNCYAVQAVYGDESVDYVEIRRNMEWCVLLFVDDSGANITNRSSDWSSSAFLSIETWAITNTPSNPALESSVIQNDRVNKPVAVLVKGNKLLLLQNIIYWNRISNQYLTSHNIITL